MMDLNKPAYFKVVVVGDHFVGKTNLINSFVHNYFMGDARPSVLEPFRSVIMLGN